MTRAIKKYKLGGDLPNRTYLGSEGGQNVSELGSFDQAIKLERNGLKNEEIRKKTGWFRNPNDKLWRFEISDKDAKLNDLFFEIIGDFQDNKTSSFISVDLGEIFEHKTMYKAYPELKFLPVLFQWKSDSNNWASLCITNMPNMIPNIFIKYNAHEDHKQIQYESRHGGSKNNWSMLSLRNRIGDRGVREREAIIIHELQHYVQVREGLGAGGDHLQNYKRLLEGELKKSGRKEISNAEKGVLFAKAFKMYLNSAGEIEARSTQKREDLTDNERKINIPFSEIEIDNEYLLTWVEEKRVLKSKGTIDSQKENDFLSGFLPWLKWWE